MNVRPVALTAALLPFFAVQLTYLVAASHGLVEWCFPYIDSCTSISATGRHPPASYLFRATMLPAAVVFIAYWWLNFIWLRDLRRQAGATGHRSIRWMLGLGIAASVGLILYVAVLGEAGDVWARQRRTGTVLFFSFTYFSQVLLAGQLRTLRGSLPTVPQAIVTAMFGVCILLLALGLLTVLLDAWNTHWYETVEDAFEWVLSLLLQGNFLLGYLVWRKAGWQLQPVNESSAL
jgi:Frag1/DRAM/Sfk1 family